MESPSAQSLCCLFQRLSAVLVVGADLVLAPGSTLVAWWGEKAEVKMAYVASSTLYVKWVQGPGPALPLRPLSPCGVEDLGTCSG